MCPDVQKQFASLGPSMYSTGPDLYGLKRDCAGVLSFAFFSDLASEQRYRTCPVGACPEDKSWGRTSGLTEQSSMQSRNGEQQYMYAHSW